MSRRQLNDNHRELLDRLVKKKGISQRKLAETIHHSQGWLAHHLSGVRKSIDNEDLQKLLEVLYASDDPNIIERFFKEAEAIKGNTAPWINHPKFKEIPIEKYANKDFEHELPKALKEFCDIITQQINDADDDLKRFVLLRMLITMTKNATYTPKLSIVLNSAPVFAADFNNHRHSDIDRSVFALYDKCYGHLFGSGQSAMYPPEWRLDQYTVILNTIQEIRSILFEIGSSNRLTDDLKAKLNERLTTLNAVCRAVYTSCNGLSVLDENTVLDEDLIDAYLSSLKELKKKINAAIETANKEIKEDNAVLAKRYIQQHTWTECNIETGEEVCYQSVIPIYERQTFEDNVIDAETEDES